MHALYGIFYNLFERKLFSLSFIVIFACFPIKNLLYSMLYTFLFLWVMVTQVKLTFYQIHQP